MPVNQEQKWSNEKFYTISAVVDRCLQDNGLPDHYFEDFLGWGLWGLREINFDIKAQQIKVIKLSMNDTRGVTLPSDFIDWVIIGLQVGEYVKTLGVNAQMTKFTGKDKTLGNPQNVLGLGINELPNSIDVLNYGGYRLLGTSVIALGAGISYSGVFQIIKNDAGKFIQFTSKVNKTDIYLEYISDGFNPNKETIVDPYSVDYLRKYINHEWAQFKPIRERSEAEIQRTGMQLYYAEKNLRARNNPLDPQTMLNLQRQYYRLTPTN